MAKGNPMIEGVRIKIEEDDSIVSYDTPGYLDMGPQGSPGSTSRDDFDDQDPNFIMIRMDIKEPLNTIKAILEDKVNEISEFKFTLQGSEELDGSKNLLDHCVQGEGLVQINLVLRYSDSGNTIDIVDVLKPSEDEDDLDDEEMDQVEDEKDTSKSLEDNQTKKTTPKGGHTTKKKAGQSPQADDPLDKISEEPPYLTQRPPNLSSSSSEDEVIEVSSASLSGNESSTTGSVLGEVVKKTRQPRKKKPADPPKKERTKKAEPQSKLKTHIISRVSKPLATAQVLQMGSPSAGPIQLWQFLLELLTNYGHRNSIQWLEREGEFKLINPEMVARLWGLRKNKPHMTYEKLSRALRYYYDGDMISKVPGRRFVYKFSCDLRFLLGYTSKQLNTFVLEAESLANEKNQHKFVYEALLPSIDARDEEDIREGVVMASDFNLD